MVRTILARSAQCRAAFRSRALKFVAFDAKPDAATLPDGGLIVRGGAIVAFGKFFA
jgi:hypothetical protein